MDSSSKSTGANEVKIPEYTKNLPKSISKIEIIPGDPIRQEVAHALFQTLRLSLVTAAFLTLGVGEDVKDGPEATILADSDSVLYILTGPTCDTKLKVWPKHWIAYDLTDLPTVTEAYLDLLRSAIAVWTYSKRNLERLEEAGLTGQYVPIGSSIIVSPIDIISQVYIYSDMNRDIDVLYFKPKVVSGRVKKILDAFKAHDISVMVEPETKLEDTTRLLRRAKLCLNLNPHEDSNFNTPLVNLIMAAQACLVSEIAPGIEDYPTQGFPPSLLISVCKCLLSDLKARHSIAVLNHQWYQGGRAWYHLVPFQHLLPYERIKTDYETAKIEEIDIPGLSDKKIVELDSSTDVEPVGPVKKKFQKTISKYVDRKV